MNPQLKKIWNLRYSAFLNIDLCALLCFYWLVVNWVIYKINSFLHVALPKEPEKASLSQLKYNMFLYHPIPPSLHNHDSRKGSLH